MVFLVVAIGFFAIAVWVAAKCGLELPRELFVLIRGWLQLRSVIKLAASALAVSQVEKSARVMSLVRFC